MLLQDQRLLCHVRQTKRVDDLPDILAKHLINDDAAILRLHRLLQFAVRLLQLRGLDLDFELWCLRELVSQCLFEQPLKPSPEVRGDGRYGVECMQEALEVVIKVVGSIDAVALGRLDHAIGRVEV